jgi:hypothetical protein
MARTTAIIRSRGTKRSSTTSRGNSTGSLKRSRTRVHVKYRGPRISRMWLRSLREDLDNTRNAMSDTVDKFWITSEHDIRDTLAKTQQKIGRAVNMLKKKAA